MVTTFYLKLPLRCAREKETGAQKISNRSRRAGNCDFALTFPPRLLRIDWLVNREPSADYPFDGCGDERKDGDLLSFNGIRNRLFGQRQISKRRDHLCITHNRFRNSQFERGRFKLVGNVSGTVIKGSGTAC